MKSLWSSLVAVIVYLNVNAGAIPSGPLRTLQGLENIGLLRFPAPLPRSALESAAVSAHYVAWPARSEYSAEESKTNKDLSVSRAPEVEGPVDTAEIPEPPAKGSHPQDPAPIVVDTVEEDAQSGHIGESKEVLRSENSGSAGTSQIDSGTGSSGSEQAGSSGLEQAGSAESSLQIAANDLTTGKTPQDLKGLSAEDYAIYSCFAFLAMVITSVVVYCAVRTRLQEKAKSKRESLLSQDIGEEPAEEYQHLASGMHMQDAV
eukprot:g37721.t1